MTGRNTSAFEQKAASWREAPGSFPQWDIVLVGTWEHTLTCSAKWLQIPLLTPTEDSSVLYEQSPKYLIL